MGSTVPMPRNPRKVARTNAQKRPPKPRVEDAIVSSVNGGGRGPTPRRHRVPLLSTYGGVHSVDDGARTEADSVRDMLAGRGGRVRHSLPPVIPGPRISLHPVAGVTPLSMSIAGCL